MFSFLARKSPLTAEVNGIPLSVNPKETLLQAALRQGIDFPNNCRVGGCASCKCKLLEGRIKELTSAAYILSDEDLDNGCVLACQSVPLTDISVEVDLSAQSAEVKTVIGRVLAQTRLTHDIVELELQMEETLTFRAGQFANISLMSEPDMKRSYSFARPPQPDAKMSFFVRKVPGGKFSSAVNDTDLVGQKMTVEGPMGEFWLRPDDSPLLAVAGGSGLAPIIAILEDALDADVKRPVTLLFGARKQADLYAVDQISDIAKRWNEEFHFVPVLSDEELGTSWSGRRGMVTSLIPEFVGPESHAYLCGPPPMVDSAVEELKEIGITASQIFADRFTTQKESAVVTK